MLIFTLNSCKLKRNRKGRFALILFILLNAPVWQGKAAEKEELGIIPAEVLCVTDGDTLKVRANIWIGQEVKTNIRLSGIDAPELKSRCENERLAAAKAKKRILSLLNISPEQNICDDRKKAKVWLKNIKNDKYGGRTIAAVETQNGADIGKTLLKEGLAYPYQVKKKKKKDQ